jgi:uncharacterized membrane protein
MQQQIDQVKELSVKELSVHECFKSLSEDKIADIAKTLIRHEYLKDQNIMKAGKTDNNSIYFLTSGSVAIDSKDKTGKHFRYVETSAPIIFGEVAFFSDDHKRTATVTALGNCVAYELRPEPEYWGAFKKVYPEGVEMLCKQMANTLARNDKQLRTLMFIPSTAQAPDIVIRIFSSMLFLLANAGFITYWIVKNGGLKNQPEGNTFFDPYPFNFLALLMGIEALIVSTLILNRQALAAQEDEKEDIAHVSVGDVTKQNTEQILSQLQEISQKLARKD